MLKYMFLALFLMSATLTTAEAGVVFLPNAANSVGNATAQVSDLDKCKNQGYVYDSCPDGRLAEECPYYSGYYKYCLEIEEDDDSG